jgi:hypothetical protein
MTEPAEEVVTVGLLLRPAANGRGGGEPMDVARKAEEDTVEVLPESTGGKKRRFSLFHFNPVSSLFKVH